MVKYYHGYMTSLKYFYIEHILVAIIHTTTVECLITVKTTILLIATTTQLLHTICNLVDPAFVQCEVQPGYSEHMHAHLSIRDSEIISTFAVTTWEHQTSLLQQQLAITYCYLSCYQLVDIDRNCMRTASEVSACTVSSTYVKIVS